MRKVLYSTRTITSIHKKEGYFHQWGIFTDAEGSSSIAIVEDAIDGTVHYLYPFQFHFADKVQEEPVNQPLPGKLPSLEALRKYIENEKNGNG